MKCSLYLHIYRINAVYSYICQEETKNYVRVRVWYQPFECVYSVIYIFQFRRR